MQRQYSLFDHICLGFDQAIKALNNTMETTGEVYPAQDVDEQKLTEKERKLSAAYMRINHAGEICAQALYHGQGVVSRAPDIQVKMQEAAIEEGDHLDWCSKRLTELNSHPSYLNPVWYAGSFCIGMTAGMVGDDWSLGFVAETERQVIKHLQGHLDTLPEEDKRSAAILQRMQSDEAKHRDEAIKSGARELPGWIKAIMGVTSKVMVKTAYYF